MIGAKELNLDFEDTPLVGVASSLYEDPSEVRYQVALETIDNYNAQRLPLVIVDASKNQEIKDGLRERGAVVIDAEPSRVGQYKQGVGIAIEAGAKKVVSHEPEKANLIKFAGQIVKALDLSDILVIGRTEAAMRTLPSAQAKWEKVLGDFLVQALNFPADALSGGRAYTPKGAKYLADYNTAKWGDHWVHLYIPALQAMEEQVPVGGLLIDMEHPVAMTLAEEGSPVFDEKRAIQFRLQSVKLADFMIERYRKEIDTIRA